MAKWFKTRLCEARKAAGLSQSQLAVMFDVTQGAVSSWENGAAEPRENIRLKVDEFIRAQQPVSGELRTAEEEDSKPIPDSAASGSLDDDEADDGDVPSPVSLAGWLAEARAKAGLSRLQLAEKAQVSTGTIYLLETGKIENPRQSTIRTLENALGSRTSEAVQKKIKESSTVEGLGEFRDFNPHADDEVPTVPGVYVFYDISDRPIYVGKAGSIKTRVNDHKDRFWFKVPLVQTAAYVEIPDAKWRDQVETLLIKFLKNNAVLNKYKRHRGPSVDEDSG